MNFATTLDELHIAMEGCEQAPSLNMLQHGELVHAKYNELMAACDASTVKHAQLRQLYEKCKLPPSSVLRQYHVYHDCGKHLVMTMVDGRKQFPNHAEASYEQYLKIFPDDLFTANLIKKDMDFHILRGDDLLDLMKHPLAPILYFTAWAEIMANAEMFGGEDSDSFKIKQKRLIQAGKKLLSH